MYSTEGIILKKINVGEADGIFSIYTRDYGKIRALAQGVKKENAKLKGHLEPFNHCAVSFVLGRNGERLAHATILEPRFSIRADLLKLGIASYMAELIHRHCLEGERDENLWLFLKNSFSELEQTKIDVQTRDTFLIAFDMNLLKHLGYAGEKDIRTLGLSVAKPF